MTIEQSSFLQLAVSKSVVLRALKVAAVIGTLLAIINHGDAVLAETFAVKNFFQVLLSYLVPYGVATYSAVNALQESAKKNQ